jgi:hypothetical protein
MFSDKGFRENQNTYFMFSNPPKNRAGSEIKRKYIVKPDRLQTKIWRKRFARRIPKATNTQSEYV